MNKTVLSNLKWLTLKTSFLQVSLHTWNCDKGVSNRCSEIINWFNLSHKIKFVINQMKSNSKMKKCQNLNLIATEDRVKQIFLKRWVLSISTIETKLPKSIVQTMKSVCYLCLQIRTLKLNDCKASRVQETNQGWRNILQTT